MVSFWVADGWSERSVCVCVCVCVGVVLFPAAAGRSSDEVTQRQFASSWTRVSQLLHSKHPRDTSCLVPVTVSNCAPCGCDGVLYSSVFTCIGALGTPQPNGAPC